MTQKILVLGAGYGGLAAALRLARKSRAEITLVNAADSFVERIRLHQLAADQKLRQRPLGKLLKNTGIRFVQGRATGLDLQRRELLVQTEAGPQTLSYDKLVYAPGSSINRDSVPGVREYAHTLDMAAELRGLLPEVAARGGRMVVIGGGLTGIEAAAEIAERYPSLRVSLISDGELAAHYSAAGRKHLRSVFERLQIRLIEHERVQEITRGQVVGRRGSYAYDLCLWAGGFAMLPLAREAGLAVNGRGQMLIDTYMRSVSHPDVYGVGDAAAFAPQTGLDVRMACATAIPMGAHTADNIAALLAGREQQPFSLGYVIHCISLGRHDGLIQFVRPDDTVRERVITGRAAAFVKEMVCRYAFYSVLLNGRMPAAYVWPRRPEDGATAAGRQLA